MCVAYLPAKVIEGRDRGSFSIMVPIAPNIQEELSSFCCINGRTFKGMNEWINRHTHK